MVMFFFGVYVIFQAARSASGGLFAVGDALALALATGCCDRLAFALKKPGAGPNSVEMGVFICLVASTAACAALAAEELGGGASKVVCWNTIVSPVMKSAGAAWWILRAVVAARIALFDPWFAQTCSASAAANVRLVACCAVGAFSLGWARQQCFVFALLFSHARDLYSATLPFANIGLADADVQAHGWIWPALWAADMYRYGLLAFPVFALGRLLVYLANCCIPAPLRFYCHPEASMGFDGAPAGMAHFIAPARVAEEGPVPCIFVCNVGMLERGYDAVIVGDATTKMSSTLPQTEGFAGQYLVNIPLFDPILTADRPSHWSAYLNGFFSPCEYKQLNLSAWSSPEKAHDWYVGNADHRSIVQAHRTGMLDTFSSMLATLSPKRGVRYDARCQECSLVNTNFPEQRRCNFCQAESPQMPLF
ncbi:hypothetical protein M885DRAFT_510473 [Pelagophyceae sp. CCMP2097]|nr:hypothetical protein M885DRAFT_510473 [Pelagophyceae sp. CCMP2097]